MSQSSKAPAPARLGDTADNVNCCAPAVSPSRHSSATTTTTTESAEQAGPLTSQRPAPDAAPDTQPLYMCPGETQPISRAVHLGRLRAFFPACANCPCRSETGQLTQSTLRKLRRHHSTLATAGEPLVTSHGLRGLNQNVMNRQILARLAAAFARLLCRDIPLIGRFAGEELPLRRRPVIVLGRDHRPGSPALTAAAIHSLLRTGCDIVDVGEATHPIMQFTVRHLNAAGGVLVTGSGFGPQFAGIDFFTSHGHLLEVEPTDDEQTSSPADPDMSLQIIRDESKHDSARPSRQPGTIRAFRARVPYVAELLRHFRRVQSTPFCVASPRGIVREHLTQLLADKPPRGKFLNVPLGTEQSQREEQHARFSKFVRSQRGQFGVMIAEDGQRADVFDETGRRLSDDLVFRALVCSTAQLYPGSPVIAEPQIFDRICADFPDQPCFSAAAGARSMSAAVQKFSARVGGGNSGRYWIDSPHSDAIALVGLLLEHIAETGTPLSRLAASAA